MASNFLHCAIVKNFVFRRRFDVNLESHYQNVMNQNLHSDSEERGQKFSFLSNSYVTILLFLLSS